MRRVLCYSIFSLIFMASPAAAMVKVNFLTGSYTTTFKQNTSAGASFAYLDSTSGLGIGVSGDVPTGGHLFSNPKEWKVVRIPIDFYYAPYISPKHKFLRIDSQHTVGFFYLSLCPWAKNGAAKFDFSMNGYAHELGVGVSLTVAEFIFGASMVNLPAFTYETTNLPAYKASKLFFRATLALPGWQSTQNEDVKTGWFPTYKERRLNKQQQRENAKPKITSVLPSKAISGSTIEITGENFRPEDGSTKIFFSNVPGEIKIVDATRATARIPGGTPAGNSAVLIETLKGSSNEGAVFVLPARPPMLTLSDVVFAGNGADRVLHAGELGEIGFAISNAKGAGTAFGVKVYPSLKGTHSADLSYASTIDVGDVGDGKARKVSIPLSAGLDLDTGELIFNIKVAEANDFASESFEVKIQSKKLEPPDLQIAKLEADDRFYPERADKLSVGNGNGVVEPGEIVEVYATLSNQGPGQTKDTRVDVVAGSPDVVFYSANRFLLGDIPPQVTQKLKFAFLVKKSYAGSVDLPIKLSVSDSRERFNKELPSHIELKRSDSPVPAAYVPKPVTYAVEDLRIPRGSNMAVAELGAKNVSTEEASKATDFLRTNLVNTEMFNVMDRGNMETVLAEQKFQSSGYTDQERAIQIGKLLNVKLIFAGSLVRINGTYFLTVDVINVETGRIVASAGEEVSSFGKLKEACGKLVNKILN